MTSIALQFDRVREVSWTATAPFWPAMAAMSGREGLEAIRDGRVAPPPIARLLGFSIGEIGDGEIEFTLTPREDLENLANMVHGGVAATLLDNALGAAIQTKIAGSAKLATLNLNVSYIRPITVRSDLVRARGRVVRLSRSTAFAEGSVTDGSGQLCATATATFAVSQPTVGVTG